MRVAAGLDLGHESHAWLLLRGVAVAQRLGAPLDLVYVGTGDAHLARLQELLRESVPEEVRGEARLLAGDPADALVQLSSQVDVLVVGPREPPGLERLYLNPMAVRVLRNTYGPVYVPRSERLGDGPVRIVAGIDLKGDLVEPVVAAIAHWAEALDATVDLLHAIPRSLPPVRRPELKEAVERAWRQAHEGEVAALTALLGRLPEARRGEALVVPGEAEDALVDASETHDLVIVGNRDRRGIERFLLGGVARVVVVRSAADVLVLPTQRMVPAPKG
ncbi:MAG: universal stress protein [Alphaproteobacteria bacterium]|nr:universal stress protein [Alphaproteobacteria bacterium]